MKRVLNFSSFGIMLVLQLVVLCCFIYGALTGQGDVMIACGIWGIISPGKPQKFDYPLFSILGIANDTRGGDSCGIFVDGNYDWGEYQKKYFCDFLDKNEILENAENKPVSVALGHCRKASAGMGPFDKAHAQPVVLTDKDGRVRFVMVHNGTIYNYEELAKKYIPKIDIKGMTDSQVMARIFYYTGYQVLSEYYGGSVFFIVDYRQPDHPAYVFQGKSKEYNYSTSTEKIERPFFFVQDDKGRFIFSSIRLHLDVMLHGKGTVYGIHQNALCKLSSKGFHIVKEFPRDKVSQTRPVSSYSTPYYGESYPRSAAAAPASSSRSSTPSTSRGSSNNWLTDDRYFESGKSTTPSTGSSKPAGSTVTPLNSSKASSTTYAGSLKLMENSISGSHEYSIIVPGSSEIKAHGRLFLTNYGTIYAKKDAMPSLREIYFFNGIPLDIKYGAHYFKYLEKICGSGSKDEFVKKFVNVISYLSMEKIYHSAQVNSLVIATSITDSSLYSGDRHALGINKYDTVSNGVVTKPNQSCPYSFIDDIFKEATERKENHVPYKTIRLACLKN